MSGIDIVIVTQAPQTLTISTTPNTVLTLTTPKQTQGPTGAGGVLVYSQNSPIVP